MTKLMLTTLLLGSAVATTALAGEQEKQMLALSATQCMGIPSMEAMNKQAIAMKLKVINEEGASKATGNYAHTKSWLVEGMSKGPFMWQVTEVSSPNGFLAKCGITGLNADAIALEKELKLGAPSKNEKDGPNTIKVWSNPKTPGQAVEVFDLAIPGERPMVTLNKVFIHKEKPKATAATPQTTSPTGK